MGGSEGRREGERERELMGPAGEEERRWSLPVSKWSGGTVKVLAPLLADAASMDAFHDCL